MIMGDTCTRACAFCNVRTGLPGPLDEDEPRRVADAVAKLGLSHVVVTSVDRDDLADGGGRHFARTIAAIRRAAPQTTVEVLTPDFLRKDGALEAGCRGEAERVQPQPRNRAVEISDRPTGRALFPASLRLLERAKELDPSLFTKSGMMVGLGEARNEVLQVMDDMRAARIDFLTIGQYLQPTPKHHAVEAVSSPPEEFADYAAIGLAKGFLLVSSSPLTRSSHHAGDDFARLKAARTARLKADVGVDPSPMRL